MCIRLAISSALAVVLSAGLMAQTVPVQGEFRARAAATPPNAAVPSSGESVVWRPPSGLPQTAAAPQPAAQPNALRPAAAPAALPQAVQQATPLPPPVSHGAIGNVPLPHQPSHQGVGVIAPAQATTPITAGASAVAAATGQIESTVTRVTSGGGVLPRDHGQVWREYDIRPYTARIESTAQPEQAIVDWIIRDTGTEVWFSEPFGLMNANRNTLRVYHTPEMQEIVKRAVDRFVGSQAQAYEFGVRLMTVNNPNWRAKAHRTMKPVGVQTPGIQAWIMSKEDAAVLLADLKQRSDFREHNSASLLIHNGQVGSLAHLRPKNYIKNVLLRNDAWPGYQVEMGQIEEGYTLSLSPLVSLDGTLVDAVIKAQVDQVEKLVPVDIAVPTTVDPRQQVEIQVPQMVSWRVHERFRWPTEQILVLSCGVVAEPGGGRPTVAGLNIPRPFRNAPPRADAIMFLEARGKSTPTAMTTRNTTGALTTPALRTGSANSFNGRY